MVNTLQHGGKGNDYDDMDGNDGSKCGYGTNLVSTAYEKIFTSE